MSCALNTKFRFLLVLFVLVGLFLVILASFCLLDAKSWVNPNKLTSLNSFGSCLPAISGDGSKIVFQYLKQGSSNYQIYIVNSDGTGLRGPFHNGTNPSISYDGTKIVFDSNVDGDNEIFMMNSDGTGLKQLTTNTVDDSLPAISGDKTTIAYHSFDTWLSKGVIKLMNSDGTGQKTVLSGNLNFGAPSISADGNKIVSQSNNNSINDVYLWVRGIGLTDIVTRFDAGYTPTISGDGSKIAYSATDGLYVINSDLTNKKGPFVTSQYASNPSISYNGSKIVFVGGWYSTGIGIINSDGTGLESITNTTAISNKPSISNDERKIAYTSNVGSNGYEVWLSTLLISPVASFTYSPDQPKLNQEIAFDASSSQDSDGSITSYTWAFGDGATATGLTVSHAFNSAQTYSVNLNVTDADKLSNSITKNVTVAPTSLGVLVEPKNQLVTVGLNAVLTASPSGGTPTYSYQWYDGTEPISEQTQNSLAISKTTAGTYLFTCKVSDSKGQTANSNAATIVFADHLTAIASPLYTQCSLNQPASFNVTAAGGSQPYTYQWYEEGAAISGKNGFKLEISKSATGNYTFYCKVNDHQGTTVDSNKVILNVFFTASLGVATEPNRTSAVIGQPVVFTVKASGGDGPYYYQWYEGTNILVDETSEKIVVSENETGSYTFICKVIDSKGNTVYSNPMALSVSSVESSSLWVVLVSIGVIATFSVGFGIWWQRGKKSDPLKGVLPPGWQFYTRPTTGEPPGTIFRITPDKKKFFVWPLAVPIRPCEEVTGKYSRKITVGILLRFHGLDNVDVTGKGKRMQQVVFGMKDATGEVTYDKDLYPALNKWVDDPKFAYQDSDRYFVIRDATKTKAINYQLTQEQAQLLTEKASFGKLLKQEGKISSKDEQNFVLPQEFNSPMRVMFNAEEIKIKIVKNKKMLSRHPVKGVLEWSESG